jgi:DNA replication protein DnaD|tara:strand:+ start:94 stop:267 length:174 start_codon:yes stop_codon:yes gene_type:complete
MKNEISKKQEEELKKQAKVKQDSLMIIKQALDIALKNGAYSTLEEVNAILGAFKNLQ